MALYWLYGTSAWLDTLFNAGADIFIVDGSVDYS